jgi:hypothetical protein
MAQSGNGRVHVVLCGGSCVKSEAEASRAALGAGGRNGTDRVILNEMKGRIEQDHEQYPPFALTLTKGAAYAPLPQATKAGAKVGSHPVA